MPPSDTDASVPNTTLLTEMMKVNKSLGQVRGELGGVKKSVSDLGARMDNVMTKDECAAVMASDKRSKRPTGESPWKMAQTRLGVVVSLAALLSICGGAFYWMVSAYNTIEKAKTVIKKTNGNGNHKPPTYRWDPTTGHMIPIKSSHPHPHPAKPSTKSLPAR